MGFLKSMKDMKEMMAAAPGMIAQAQQLQAQANATYGSPAAMMSSPRTVPFSFIPSCTPARRALLREGSSP